MAYSKEFKSDPYLVNFVGGMGKGVQRAGQALASLGDDKIAKAKADAAKKEADAKTRALNSATASKNRALNPSAVKKINESYGIKEGSPLSKNGAPTQANTDISLIDLGKGDAAVAPKLKFVKPNADGFNVKYFTDGSKEVTTEKAYVQKLKSPAPKSGTVRGVDGKNYNTLYDPKTKKFVNTGNLASVQPTTAAPKTSKPNIVDVDSLTPQESLIANKMKIKFYKDGKVVVDKSKLSEAVTRGNLSKGKDKIFGDEEGF